MINRFRNLVANAECWLFVIVAISATPLIQGFFTTTLDGYVTYPQSVIRVLSLVTILTDILIVGIAIKLKLFRSIQFDVAFSTKCALAILFSLAIFTVFWSKESVFFSLFITIRIFFQLLVLFCLIHIISSSDKFRPDHYFAVMAIALFLYALYIVSIVLLIPDPARFYWLGGLPSATNVRHIGNYVAILSIAAMALFLFGKSPNHWRILPVIFFVIAFLAWTGSRAAFVGLIVALPAASYAVRRHVSLKRTGVLAITLGLAVVATIPLPAPDPSYGVMRMITASDAAQNSDISSARTEIWARTIQEIVASPVIGHGAGRFLGNMDAKYKYDLDNPHNFVLQFAYDWGIAGLAIVIFLLVVGSVRLIKLPVISPEASFCAVSGLMLMLSIGMLEGMFYHPMKMLLVSALIAPAFALARRQRIGI